MYVDYNFECRENSSIVFDKELDCDTFFETQNLSDGQMCMLKNVDGRLVLWISDFVEPDSGQMSFDFSNPQCSQDDPYEESLVGILYRNKT
jgi:hypothetical protein